MTYRSPQEEFHKAIALSLGVVHELISDVKRDCSLNNLIILEKEIHKFIYQAAAYGYEEVFNLCHEIDLSLITKIKNYHLTKITPEYFRELDQFLLNLEKSIDVHYKIIETETVSLLKKQKKKRIILIDDNEDLTDLLRHEFHRIGCDVDTFKTGEEARAFLSNPENLKDVLLIILDRLLPDMDGLDILDELMKHSPVKVPVLILSVLSTEGDVISGMQRGAVDYITKPFSVFMLMQKVLNMLKIQNF